MPKVIQLSRSAACPLVRVRVPPALCGLVFGLVVAVAECDGQGTLRVTFEGPPAVTSGAAIYVQQYSESGIWFRPLGVVGPGNGFIRSGRPIYPDPYDPNDGTAYVQASAGDSMMFSFLNGSVFGLASVDLAEYSSIASAQTVALIGYRADGSTVSTNLSLDGIIDGTGHLADFQTFHFGPEFSNLTRVEMPGDGWSLDNLVLNVPEPSSPALLLTGFLLLSAWRYKKR